MSDTLQIISDSVVTDTLSVVSDTLPGTSVTTLFQRGPSDIVINNLPANEVTDILTFVLVGLLAVLALIWYLLPDRIISVFSIKISRRSYSDTDVEQVVPGKFISGFLWLATMVSYTILFYEFASGILFEQISTKDRITLLFHVLLVVISVILFRVVFEYLVSFIFKTGDLLAGQFEYAGKIHLISGIVLLPLLLLFLYIDSDIMIFILLIMFLLAQVFRIIVIARIGKSSAMFSALHIILYLCTLEIIPVLVLIRLIETGFLL